MGQSITSLQKGLDILRLFDFDSETFSAQAISGRLSIPLSTTYRYLETLREKGFLVRNQETKAYELGFMLFKLGDIVSSRMRLAEIVQPHMKSLSSLSGETVLLTVISGWEVVCIEKVETNRRIKLSLERGSSLPLHAGASSKILLAFEEEQFVDALLKRGPLTKFTRSTITDPRRLRKELRTIRKQRFSVSDQEVDRGAIAIGAPLMDHRGKAVGGLTVAGPRERINGKKKEELIEMVIEFAQKASHDLGYRGHRRR
jgi:IclR family KDG regulon transcriptional repressor